MVGEFSYEAFDPITIRGLKARYKTLLNIYVYSSDEKKTGTIHRVCTKIFGPSIKKKKESKPGTDIYC